jgi:hypothetical protein
MSKRFELTFLKEDIVAVAELTESKAPETCRILWDALPFEGDLVHGIWSGPECYLPIDPQIQCPAEYQSKSPLPGEIGFYSQKGGRIIGWPDDFSEIAVFYGRDTRPSMPHGRVCMNIFARIVDGFDAFAEVCARTHREGVKPLRVARLP